MLYMRADAPYKSMDDIKNATTPPKCGASGITSTGYYLPKLMEEILGTKFEIVLGLSGRPGRGLAVERGEIVCRAFTITAYIAREPFISWRKRGFVNELMQSGAKRDPRLERCADDLRAHGQVQNRRCRQKSGKSSWPQASLAGRWSLLQGSPLPVQDPARCFR